MPRFNLSSLESVVDHIIREARNQQLGDLEDGEDVVDFSGEIDEFLRVVIARILADVRPGEIVEAKHVYKALAVRQ